MVLQQVGAEPPQVEPHPKLTDFRGASMGPRGYLLNKKRKLDEYQEQVERDAEEAAARTEEPQRVGAVKRPKLNTHGVGKVSGRPWKAPSSRASAVVQGPAASSSWEKKMLLRAQHSTFLQLKRGAQAEHKEKVQAERQRKEAAKAARKERQEAALKVQKITNPNTLKRMMKSKKARNRLLRTKEDALKK